MNKIPKLVLQGLGAVLPLGLTLYFIYWLLSTAERLAEPLLVQLIPAEHYFPGLGIIATIIFLFLAGLLVNAYGVRYLIQFSHGLLEKIPLIKSVYGAFQDIIKVFNLTDKDMKSVVGLDIGNDMHLIGFITGESTGKSIFGDSNKVGIYLPMSYQIGGFTLYVERERLKPLDLKIEEAMRIALTGGIKGS